ncbi:hypothetical protein ACIPSA_00810 [Streptomyces sp. NPDC086549]|uniref:hypothetical protein n=1 Tax=Streptomyces sp. NPDC086549 TaxID=3365752 RepID=UPI00382EB7B6
MGIRMLHRRTAQARTTAQADTAAAPSMPPSRIPALAADASTARIPTDLTTAVRKAAANLRRRLTTRAFGADRALAWRHWADLGRGYLALLLTLLPRPRPPRRMTVFVAPLTERPYGSAPHGLGRERQEPGPDARP